MRYVLILFLFFSGCAGHSAEHAEIKTGSPVVYIHPMTADLSQASVAVLPFQVPQGMSIEQGEKVASLFRDVLLGKQAFQTVKLGKRHYDSLEEAAERAGELGTQLVMAGKINYLVSGAKLGGNRVDVSVRIIDVKSGNTVWYIQQTMDQKMNHPDVSFKHRLGSIFSIPPVRSSESAPVVANMLVNIAVDMSEVMVGARSVEKM